MFAILPPADNLPQNIQPFVWDFECGDEWKAWI